MQNNKDYFDQSLDEIKLLKYINEADPEDEHGMLRLFDYFYYKVRVSTVMTCTKTLQASDSHSSVTPDALLLCCKARQAVAVITSGTVNWFVASAGQFVCCQELLVSANLIKETTRQQGYCNVKTHKLPAGAPVPCVRAAASKPV